MNLGHDTTLNPPVALDAVKHRTQSHLGVVAFRLWLEWLKSLLPERNLACRTVALYLAGANPVPQVNSHHPNPGPRRRTQASVPISTKSRPLGAEGKRKGAMQASVNPLHNPPSKPKGLASNPGLVAVSPCS